MASKKTLKSTSKRKPKSTRKRKPKSIGQILVAKGVPKLELTKAEERIIHNEQEKYVKKLMEREIDELRQLLKPRLDLEKAMQEAGPDSPLAQAVKGISPKPRRYTEDHLGFRAPPTAREAASTALRSRNCDVSVLTPPYSPGHPLSEEVGDDVTGALAGLFWTSSELAIPSAGALSVGVANGRWLQTDWPSSHNWPGGDANSASAWITHLRHFIGPEFPVKKSMEVTIDVIVGDPGGLSIDPRKLLPGGPANTWVGVKGVMSLTLAGDQETWAPRTNTKTFLWETAASPGSTHLPIDDIDDIPLEEQFSLSETLVLKPGATWAAVKVLASLYAFRGSVDVPLAGFSEIDLRTQDPSFPTHAIAPYQLAAGAIIIDTMSIVRRPLPSVLARF